MKIASEPTPSVYACSEIGLHGADPLQKCFMGTSGIRTVDWDGSNERERLPQRGRSAGTARSDPRPEGAHRTRVARSEEHTSELQSRSDLVCRLLLDKKKQTPRKQHTPIVFRCRNPVGH